ncbi:MAG: hypothetical protein ABR587_11075 [Candidatus Binatia bacterium]
MVEAADEAFHAWPADSATTWKENWYWNMADREAGVWGFCHASFVRSRGAAVFAACFMVDGRIRFHRNEFESAGEPVLDDGTLRVDIVEPHRHHRVTVDTPEYRLDLDYRARFAPFHYGGRRIAANRQAIEHLRLKRYEQGMAVSGTCTIKDGAHAGGPCANRTFAVDCHGHRDHSWGKRDESRIGGWNWAAVQMPDKTINLTRSFSGDVFNVNGFVSTARGNTGVVEVDFETLETEADGRTPVATRYTFRDENGRQWHLRSRRFSDLFEPLRAIRAQQKTIIFENFADYELEETGEKGWGIDEYQRHFAA